jgi:hypothetical protein
VVADGDHVLAIDDRYCVEIIEERSFSLRRP